MTKQIFSFILFGGIILFAVSCNDKPVKQAPQPIEEQPVFEDTIQSDTIIDVVEEIPEPPKPENKYFLIAASFRNQVNAEKLRDRLIAEGYESEVIIRQTGINPDFYKVSYKGFSDKSQALRVLRDEMSQGSFPDVWLLIK
ncbi:MAG: SPOR domain-containing protein [Marinilabiliaceae bacterium]|nr:SPOR domain-containing protein [Marinilabiliaceae bacterium]